MCEMKPILSELRGADCFQSALSCVGLNYKHELIDLPLYFAHQALPEIANQNRVADFADAPVSKLFTVA